MGAVQKNLAWKEIICLWPTSFEGGSARVVIACLAYQAVPSRNLPQLTKPKAQNFLASLLQKIRCGPVACTRVAKSCRMHLPAHRPEALSG